MSFSIGQPPVPPSEAPCLRCNGTGKIVEPVVITPEMELAREEFFRTGILSGPPTPTPKVDICVCEKRRKILDYIGEPLRSAARLSIPMQDAPLLPHIGENLLITGPWETVSSHLRLALFAQTHKHFNDSIHQVIPSKVRFRLTCDEELRSAYFARADAHESDGTKTEGYRDIASSRYHLLIVQLGMTSLKNVAIPAALHCALEMRIKAGVPTWLVATLEEPFQKGHYAWDPKVGDLVAKHYRPAVWGGERA